MEEEARRRRAKENIFVSLSGNVFFSSLSLSLCLSVCSIERAAKHRSLTDAFDLSPFRSFVSGVLEYPHRSRGGE